MIDELMFLCFYLQTSLSSAPGRPSTIWSFTSWLSTVSSEPVTFPSSSVQLRPLPVLFSKPPGRRLHVDHSYFYNRINTQNSNIYKNGKTKKNRHQKKKKKKNLSDYPSLWFLFFLAVQEHFLLKL